MKTKPTMREGFVMPLVLTLMLVLSLLFLSYSLITMQNIKTTASTGRYSSSFYAAEAALNSRVESVRGKLAQSITPTGVSPADIKPCLNGNNGSGDMVCQTAKVGRHNAVSYVKQFPANSINIPVGEQFEGLSATETPYTVYGRSLNAQNNPEAITQMTFRSRQVPLFQFAVFFDKDLEFDNAAPMTLTGPVHTNGWLFLDGEARLKGQVSSAEKIFRGWKQKSGCNSGTFVDNAAGTAVSVPTAGCRYEMTKAIIEAKWLNRMRNNIGHLEVPSVGVLQPKKDATYWSKADVHVVLKATGTTASTTWTPLFVDVDGNTKTVTGPGCANALSTRQTLRDNREAQNWDTAAPARANRRTLDINVRDLLACVQANKTVLGLSGLNDVTDNGLVIYATVDDYLSSSTVSGGLLRSSLGAAGTNLSQTDPAVRNNYAVRLTNGAQLSSSNAADPKPKGITFASDQAVFIQGNFNSGANAAAGWIPAAVMSDSINVLSENWDNPEQCYSTDIKVGNNIEWSRKTWYYRDKYGWSETPKANYSPMWSTGNVWKVGDTTWYAYASGSGRAETLTPTVEDPDIKSRAPLACRSGKTTTINAAILAGTATTGADEKAIYTTESISSGGVHNMMRFHENWHYGQQTGSTYNYRGSLVSLAQPLHADGPFQLDKGRYYTPPIRSWSFESAFTDPDKLPPLSPMFVYVKQDNFTRQFER